MKTVMTLCTNDYPLLSIKPVSNEDERELIVARSWLAVLNAFAT